MVTVQEYLIAHRKPVGLAIKESVTNADYSIDLGERVRYATPATFSVEGKDHSGVVVVTTHRLICCSSVRHNLVRVSMPFSHSLGIGDESGLLLKQLPISCDNISVSVKASGDSIKQMRKELLDAIEAAPNQKDLHLGGVTIFRQSAEDHRRTKKIKSDHSGERRLSKAEATAYGPCPDCKGTVIVEKGRMVYCLKCGHQFLKCKK